MPRTETSGPFTTTETGIRASSRSEPVICLDLANGSQERGGMVVQWPCVAGDYDQLWKIVPSVNGTYTLESKTSRQCLEVLWSYPYENASVGQWPCKEYNPRWTISNVTPKN